MTDGPWLNLPPAVVVEATGDIQRALELTERHPALLVIKANELIALRTEVPLAADAELVSGTLSGDREAFEKIITRYQGLICSLTYSATGNLGHSEDLAQEIFISAWKHLGQLRERDKLRSWLCGIARNRINNFLRREGR